MPVETLPNPQDSIDKFEEHFSETQKISPEVKTSSDREISKTIEDFDRMKDGTSRLKTLKKIRGIIKNDKINDQLLDFVDRVANDPEKFDSEIYANYNKSYDEIIEHLDNYEDTSVTTSPAPYIMSDLLEIVLNAKGTNYQEKALGILYKILNNWNEYSFNLVMNDDYIDEPIRQGENTYYGYSRRELKDNEYDYSMRDLSSYEKSYPHHLYIVEEKNIIYTIGELGNKQSVDFLIDYVLKDERSVFNNELAVAFTKIDTEYATKLLIDLLENYKSEIVSANARKILSKLSPKSVDEANINEETIFYRTVDRAHIKCRALELDIKNSFFWLKRCQYLQQSEIEKLYNDLTSTSDNLFSEIKENYAAYDQDQKNSAMSLINKLIEKDLTFLAALKEFNYVADELNMFISELAHKKEKGKLVTNKTDMIFMPSWIFDSDETGLDEVKKFLGSFHKHDSELLLAKLSKLISHKNRLKEQLEKVVRGEISLEFPEGYLGNLENEINSLKPEGIKTPAYFPVGISKDMSKWDEVFEHKLQVGKPIDIYGYLFWLNNQGEKITLVVCDTIQKTNYENSYHISDEEAEEKTRMIGQEEKKYYQKIIDTFGLNNIVIADYSDLVGNTEYFKFRQLCDRVADKDIFKESFSDAVQESISDKKERDKYLPYVLEEIAWILSRNETKISHSREARYDTLAALIYNILDLAKKHKESLELSTPETIFDDENQQKMMSLLSDVKQKLLDLINTKMSDLPTTDRTNSETYAYYSSVLQVLKKIKITPKKNFHGDKIEFNFYISNQSSKSFGWRTQGQKETAVMKFREPYSTYFYSQKAAFLDSDQIIASALSHVSGKILALPAQKQLEYSEKVAKPLLVNFFKVIRNAPASYFEEIGLNYSELLANCKQARTLSDLINFIQSYVVWPSNRWRKDADKFIRYLS